MRLVNIGITDEQHFLRFLPQLQLDPDVLDEALLGHRRQNSMQRLSIHFSVESFILLVVGDQLVQLGRVVDHFVESNGFQNGVGTS